MKTNEAYGRDEPVKQVETVALESIIQTMNRRLEAISEELSVLDTKANRLSNVPRSPGDSPEPKKEEPDGYIGRLEEVTYAIDRRLQWLQSINAHLSNLL